MKDHGLDPKGHASHVLEIPTGEPKGMGDDGNSFYIKDLRYHGYGWINKKHENKIVKLLKLLDELADSEH